MKVALTRILGPGRDHIQMKVAQVAHHLDTQSTEISMIIFKNLINFITTDDELPEVKLNRKTTSSLKDNPTIKEEMRYPIVKDT